MPTRTVARTWLDRWDRQQEFYLADREERFTVIADVIASVVDRPDPLVLDLGCGPGSTSVRMLDRLPGAEVVGLDADPFLLGLARAAYDDRPGLRFVEHDLRIAGWVEALALERPVDAVVSTTALHWLVRDELAAVYAACARLVRPGGLLVDGDHLFDGSATPRLTRLNEQVREARALRVGLDRPEEWTGWWDAARRAPELRDLTATRRRVRWTTRCLSRPPSPSTSSCCMRPDSARSARSGSTATTAYWSPSADVLSKPVTYDRFRGPKCVVCDRFRKRG